jgi:hypothetical protein
MQQALPPPKSPSHRPQIKPLPQKDLLTLPLKDEGNFHLISCNNCLKFCYNPESKFKTMVQSKPSIARDATRTATPISADFNEAGEKGSVAGASPVGPTVWPGAQPRCAGQ